MHTISNDVWKSVEPKLKLRCPRLTVADFQEAQQRIDLLSAKIQSRHWVSREDARRIVLSVLKDVGALAAS